MLRPELPIRTARLLLRRFGPGDLDAVFAMRADEGVTRYLYEGPVTRERARAVLDRKRGQVAIEAEGQSLALAAVRLDDGALIGDVTLTWTSRSFRQGEIGYVLSPAAAGHGYATEAAAELLRLAFDGLGLHRVVARCDARNGASVRVMQRLGMRHEAHLVHNELVRGEWTDEVVRALLEDEWRTRGVRP